MENGKTPAGPASLTLVRLDDGVGTIVMNDRKRLNCLGSAMAEELRGAIDRLEREKARAIVLRAYPACKTWSAGHDIREIPTDGDDPLAWSVPFERLLHWVRRCSIPIIGAVEGGVWGGACDLAMCCDLLVGTPTATFAITPAKVGIPYNPAGMSHFLGALPMHIIKEMFFTGCPLSAQDALRFGVLNRLVAPEELENASMGLARTIASRAPKVIRVLKTELRKLTAGPHLTPDDFEEIQNLRQLAYRSADLKEGLAAFREKRPPVFKDQ